MDDPSQMASIGLSSEQARARLAIDGPNSIAATRHRTLIQIALNVLREPMLALLAASGVIYALIGEPSDSIVLLGLAMLSIAIAVIQEVRTERAIEALAALTSLKAL